MWYRSNVFMCFPFFSVFMISIVSVILPYACPVFNMWFEYPELQLLLLIACICSLYLVWNARPVCPMYLSWQSRHFIWYILQCNKLQWSHKAENWHSPATFNESLSHRIRRKSAQETRSQTDRHNHVSLFYWFQNNTFKNRVLVLNKAPNVWRSGGTVLRILGTRWRWMIRFTFRPVYLRERTENSHSIWDLIDSRVGSDIANTKISFLSGYRFRIQSRPHHKIFSIASVLQRLLVFSGNQSKI
jgi:hypothetical protein